LEEDSCLPEIVDPQHFELVAAMFNKVQGARRVSHAFRDTCSQQILKRADPALWLRLISDQHLTPLGKWCADAAVKVTAQNGDLNTFRQFATLCSRVGYGDELIQMAERFPEEGASLLLELTVNSSALPAVRLSAAAWLLSRDHPQSYRIITELSVENAGSGVFSCWGLKSGNIIKTWSDVTGISRDLLMAADKALSPVWGGVRYDPSQDLREMEKALERLCSITNPLSTAILGRVAVRGDGEQSIGEVNPFICRISLSDLRAQAAAELKKRRELQSDEMADWYRSVFRAEHLAEGP
jgi:hypothetical protein